MSTVANPNRIQATQPLPAAAGRHQCGLPPSWFRGALWRCPEGHLWVVESACPCRGRLWRHTTRPGGPRHVRGLAWWPATWWQRLTLGVRCRPAALTMTNPGERLQPAARARINPWSTP